MKPLKAKIRPLDIPAAIQRLRICFDDKSLRVLKLSSIIADSRDTTRASKPEESAAATAELTATRHAIFEKGRIFVKIHE